jgi:carbon-monoxide dehydrogenase large subunit
MTRVEDSPLLRGKGRFVDDLQLPDALHVAFLRSPAAHARLRGGGHSIETRGVAAQLPHRAKQILVAALGDRRQRRTPRRRHRDAPSIRR